MRQNNGLISLFWRFIRPELDEIVLYVATAIIIFGVAIYQLAVNGQIGSDTTDITASLHNAISATGTYISQGSGWASFFLFGFWFIIGGIAYTLVWAITTIIIDIRNDLRVSETFIHPRSFHKSDFWVSIISRTLVRAFSGIALLFYSVFWLWVFAPVSVTTTERFINNPGSFSSVVNFLLAIVGVIITLHIAAILVRLTLLRPTGHLEDELLQH